jgi:hypothetical protein
MLFANQRIHKVTLPVKDENGTPSNVAFLVRYLCDNKMQDSRKELFVLDGTVYVPFEKSRGCCSHIVKTTWHPGTHK